MYDFLRRPAWIVSHVLVAALIVLAVVLGFWQRSRYYEENGKQDRLDELAARPPVPYGDVVDADESPDAVDPDVEFTRVEVTGRYDTDAEVAILNRSNGRRSGCLGAHPAGPGGRDGGAGRARVDPLRPRRDPGRLPRGRSARAVRSRSPGWCS